MHRVAAVIIDHDWQGLGLPQGACSKPVSVEFTHDGSCWFEALDQLITAYSVEHRGGRRIDAEDLELRSCAIIKVDL